VRSGRKLEALVNFMAPQIAKESSDYDENNKKTIENKQNVSV
jgi:hypothetical protein